MNENQKGCLWLTTMGRVVLDNHPNEVFSTIADKKLMSEEELTDGISLREFLKRLKVKA